MTPMTDLVPLFAFTKHRVIRTKNDESHYKYSKIIGSTSKIGVYFQIENICHH